ncbi:hypothetical protein D047_2323, partial [Vibrio parahaemolyticus VPTS-2010_2]
MNGSWLDLSNR